VNKVGTYGVGSASYWWARMGAAGLRAMHYLLGHDHPVYALLYADDGQIVARGDFHRTLVLAICIWLVFDFPLKWEKVGGGVQYDYIGYWMDWSTFRVGINQKRTQWLLEWIKAATARMHTDKTEMAEVLGRWTFASRVLTSLRPFLGPMYAWQARLKAGKQRIIPAMILLILEFLTQQLQESSTVPSREVRSEGGEAFRADARADEDSAEVGAWECKGGAKPPNARWFTLKMDRKNHPWVFYKGEPKRVIAALELWVTLVAFMLFNKPRTGADQERISVLLPASTDNKGNGHMLDKLMTTAFPSCAVLMELAVQLHKSGCILDLAWLPREENVEADELSNGDTHRFAAEMEIKIDPAELETHFILLRKMLERGQILYEEVYAARDAEKGLSRRSEAWGARTARRQRKKLRIRAPWNEPFPIEEA
jgi:hypothetical protein